MTKSAQAEWPSPSAGAVSRAEGGIAKAEAEIQRISDEGADLFRKIDALVRDFANRHGCEANIIMEMIDDGIVDLVDDATGPAYRRKCRLENELSELQA